MPPAHDRIPRSSRPIKPSGPPRWNTKRIAAAIAPEIAAEAPIIGANSPKCTMRCASAPAAAVAAQNIRKRSHPNRRAIGGPNANSQITIEKEMIEVGVEERIGDEGPDLRPPPAGQPRRRRFGVARGEKANSASTSLACSLGQHVLHDEMDARRAAPSAQARRPAH